MVISKFGDGTGSTTINAGVGNAIESGASFLLDGSALKNTISIQSDGLTWWVISNY